MRQRSILNDLIKRKALRRESHMILPVIILNLLLYRLHTLLILCVFLFNRFESLPNMLQWPIFFLPIRRWKIIVYPYSGGLSTWSIPTTNLRVCIDHVIRWVIGARSHSLVFYGRHFPSFHPLIDVVFDKLLWACFGCCVLWYWKTIYRFLKCLFPQLDFMDLLQKLFFFSL